MKVALIRELESLLEMSSVDHVTSIYFGGGMSEPKYIILFVLITVA